MTDHLPECYQYDHSAHHYGDYWCNEDCETDCICDRLRACEQRAYSEAAEEMMRGTIQLENTRIRDEGYAAGLDSAREAVVARFAKDSIAVRSQTEWGVEIALAAIDNLRGSDD